MTASAKFLTGTETQPVGPSPRWRALATWAGIAYVIISPSLAMRWIPVGFPGRVASLLAVSLPTSVTYLTLHVLATAIDTIPLLCIVYFIELQPWESIGFRIPSIRDGGLAIAVAIAGLASQGAQSHVHLLLTALGEQRSAWYQNNLPLWALFLIIALDAFDEELGSRAYVFERVNDLCGSKMLAGLSSLVISVATHIPLWGLRGALDRAILFLLLVLLYAYRRNVFTCTLGHFLIDAEFTTLTEIPARITIPILKAFGFVLQGN